MTTIEIDGTKFILNGKPTYEGRDYRGRSIEGLLFNSRMVQAIFDDECAETRACWRYPDIGVWDPQRNTEEFCAMLPVYRAHGLLAVTVGLQGGGSIYTPATYNRYRNSAFTAEGELKPEYFARLHQVLSAADACGVIVMVNYFYFKQASIFEGDKAVLRATTAATDWLLESQFRNVLVDVANESGTHWPREIFHPEQIHRLIECVQQTTTSGRRLLVSASGWAHDAIPYGKWLATGDMAMPHGNDCTPQQLHDKVARMMALEEYRSAPKPVLINEDSIFIDNLEECARSGWSWGFYSQGYGADYKDARMDWTKQPRETEFERLSGYQTLPVNWSINSPEKEMFFSKLREITQGA